MAEARSAVSELRFLRGSKGIDADTKAFILSWRKTLVRSFFRTRNRILNGMWPTSIWNFRAAWFVLCVVLLGDWEFLSPLTTKMWSLGNFFFIGPGVPFYLRTMLVAGLCAIIFFVIFLYIRRWTLRILLHYRGWMYDPPKRPSWQTRIWSIIVMLVSGYRPTTYSYQNSLPLLPVPSLDATVSQFLASVKPLLDTNSEKWTKLIKDAEDFKKNVGPKLQRILLLKAWWSQNWVTDWWEKYVYHMNRSPLAINSNYYILDHSYWKPTDCQISRAASTIYQLMLVKRQIDHEEWSPLVIQGTVPLCMAQYERVFATTRIPGEEIDEFLRSDSSKHITVMFKGIYYALNVYDMDGNLLNPQNLEKQLQWIVDDVTRLETSDYDETSRHIAALTGSERTEWAKLRRKYLSTGVNKDSLDAIEKGLFHVVLETVSCDTLSERGKFMIHGNGSNIWFDKSVCVIVFNDGRIGFNAEHSWGDAPTLGHVLEFSMTNEVNQRLYDENGHCWPMAEKQSAFKNPVRLVWQVEADLANAIENAVSANKKHNADLDLCVEEHKAYGKGFIKKCKVSPDAYIQAALQLTFYREQGHVALTYEAAMMRLFKLGRTETVRSLTEETAAFIKAMDDSTRSVDEKKKLLKLACDRHQMLYRNAMNGQGIDRHMFGLYVVSKGLGYDSEFLREALTMPWTLSTSQQPQQQISTSPDCNLPIFSNKVSPGGGFGPVSDEGYGISYMFAGDNRLFFHISSKHSTSATNSKQFMDRLCESFADMKKLFDH